MLAIPNGSLSTECEQTYFPYCPCHCSIKVGLPPFLVITLFCPIEEDDFYIGKQTHAERAKEQGKPFVRIVSQHLARTAEGKERRMATIQRLEDRFRGMLEAKNCEWEVSRPSRAEETN